MRSAIAALALGTAAVAPFASHAAAPAAGISHDDLLWLNRITYGAELEQLRLQVEVMGVLVDQNLERMRQVLRSGRRVAIHRPHYSIHQQHRAAICMQLN